MLKTFYRAKHSKRINMEEIVDTIPKGTRTIVDLDTTDASLLCVKTSLPKKVTLNFLNTDTYTVFKAIQDDTEGFIDHCRNLWSDTSKEEFQSLLIADLPTGSTERAAQLYYINQLSTPGTERYQKPAELNETLICAWSELLSDVTLTNKPWYELIETGKKTETILVDTEQNVTYEETKPFLQDITPNLLIVGPDVDGVPLQKCGPGKQTPDKIQTITSH